MTLWLYITLGAIMGVCSGAMIATKDPLGGVLVLFGGLLLLWLIKGEVK